MFQNKLIEPFGLIWAAAAFLFSLYLFYSDTTQFLGSVAAALMSAALAWMTYVFIRLIVFTIKK